MYKIGRSHLHCVSINIACPIKSAQQSVP